MANDYDDIVSPGNGTTSSPVQTLTARAPVTTKNGLSSAAPTEGAMIVEEVAGSGTGQFNGETGVETSPTDLHSEVGTEGAEAGEEFFEATPEQLAMPLSQENNAESDLAGIEGFEATEYGLEALEAGLEAADSEGFLDEVGAESAGTEEFLPILASLVPTLVSTVGPAIAKGISSKLSQKSRRRLARIGMRPRPTTPVRRHTPSPSDLLATIARLLNSVPRAQSAAFETGAEALVDEALVEEAVRVLEVIIGRDDRVKISATTKVPWRRICALRITFPSGATYRGTGFFIGPRTVATAGHCVYLHNQGGWARRIEVIPGANGPARPFGAVTATSFRSVSGWVSGRKSESDYGCIVLPQGSFGGGSHLGSFGFASYSAATLLAQTAVVAGYPGDKPFAELWGMSRRLKRITRKTLIYDIDTMGGQSGAPVYIKKNGQRHVIGIHNYGASSGNSATRITQPVFQMLQKWSKL